MWALHLIRGRLSSLKFGPVLKVPCRSPLSSHHTAGAQTLVVPNPRRGQHFPEPIECLKDGISSEEALTTIHRDAGVAAGRIMEDADAGEVALQHIVQHRL